MDNNMADNGKLPVRTLDISVSLQPTAAGPPDPSNSEYTQTDPECSDNVMRSQNHMV